MCQSSVYILDGEDEELVMEQVVSLDVDGDQINMRSLFGEPLSLAARVTQIDLVKNRIILEGRE